MSEDARGRIEDRTHIPTPSTTAIEAIAIVDRHRQPYARWVERIGAVRLPTCGKLNDNEMRTSITLLLIFIAACGEAPSRDMPDAGTMGAVPLPPEPPTPPSSECPPNWHRAEGGLGCEPWAAGESIECPFGQTRFPSQTGCEPPPCPDGEYASELPAGQVRHVSQRAAADGDGSIARPFDSIARALEGAAPGTVIALGSGTFTVPSFLELGPELSLIGACAARTTVRSDYVERGRALVRARAGTVRLRGLTLTSSLVSVASTGPGTLIELHDVIADAPSGIGLLATDGARIMGTGVIVRDVQSGGDVKSAGIAARRAGIVELTRVRIERAPGYGVLASDEGTRVALVDAYLVDTRPDGSLGICYSVLASAGAEVRLERTLVEGGLGVGLSFGEVGTHAILRDVVVRDVGMRDEEWGAGVAVGLDASLDAARLLVERTPATGVYVLDASATLSDVVIRDIYALSKSSAGLAVLRRSEATLARAALINIPGAAFTIARGARASAEDISIIGTLPTSWLPEGAAILGVDGAELELARARFEDNESGIVISTHATARLGDIDARRSRGDSEDLFVGYGLMVTDSSNVSLERASFDRMRGEAIVVQDFPEMVASGSRLTGSHIQVTHTESSAFVTLGAYGSGLVVALGAYAQISHFRFADNAFCGVRILVGGTADLADGEVLRNQFGADVDTEGFDIARIYDGVVYLDNSERNAVVRTGRPPPTITLPAF